MVKKILHNKKGETLMELVVAMLVFALIATAVSSIIFPMLRSYADANELAEINTLLDNVSQELVSDLGRAKSISMEAGTGTLTVTTALESVLYAVKPAKDGQQILYRGGFPVLDADYYKRKSIEISYHKVALDVPGDQISEGAFPSEFFVWVALRKEGEILASRSYAVKPLAMQQYETSKKEI